MKVHHFFDVLLKKLGLKKVVLEAENGCESEECAKKSAPMKKRKKYECQDQEEMEVQYWCTMRNFCELGMDVAEDAEVVERRLRHIWHSLAWELVHGTLLERKDFSASNVLYQHVCWAIIRAYDVPVSAAKRGQFDGAVLKAVERAARQPWIPRSADRRSLIQPARGSAHWR